MSHEMYFQNEVLTANPGKLVLLLYDGAIRFLKRLDGMDYSQNIEIKNYNINKASSIISELQRTLNMEYDEVAKPLFSLYTYMGQKLLESNLRNTSEGVIEVKGMLEELKSTWGNMITSQVTEVAEASVPAPVSHAQSSDGEDSGGFLMAC
jgi:flagellar secretion chaperone FliS